MAGWFSLVTVETLIWLVVILEAIALASVPSVLLRRRGRPVSALAWLLGLLALPGLGSLAWWAIGRTTLERKRRKRVRKKRAFARKHDGPTQEPGTRFDAYFPPRARGEDTFSSSGNHVQLLTGGQTFFPALESALRTAVRSIHLEMYIFEFDETGERMLRILENKARSGLDVRVLLDGFGSQDSARKIERRLTASGAKVALFLPSRLFPLHSPRLNFTNHRKIIVIDDLVAFTGGMNIGRQYHLEWKDLMICLRGPVVRGLHHVFLDDWYFATDETTEEPATPEPFADGCEAAVVTSGPDTEAWIHDAYFLAVTEARTRISIVTPYFIPSQSIITALRTAAGRGVDVRVMLPSLSDVTLVKWASRSYYRQLISAGVRIFEYQGSMLHAKALVQDERIASVGTANVDSRSFGLSFEVSCFVESKDIHDQLHDWIDELERDSVEIVAETLDQKRILQKLGESAAHLLSPLL